MYKYIKKSENSKSNNYLKESTLLHSAMASQGLVRLIQYLEILNNSELHRYVFHKF